MFRSPSAAPGTVLGAFFVIAALAACSPGGGSQTSGQEGASPTSVAEATAPDGGAAFSGERIGYYGYGQPATDQEIAGWDIDIRPDGKGLPEGSGSVEDGEWIYEEQCAECHGSFGEGVGRFPVLAGGQGTLRDARPTRTVGSYWPYTSTLYDYIRRTMPFTRPESLSDDDTYAVTAYVLYLNDLVEDDFVLTHENLVSVRLPNEGNFVPDARPDVANARCMADCRDPAAITILSEAGGGELALEQGRDAGTAAGGTGLEVHPGQATYQQFCSICHDIGVAGAPQLNAPEQWAGRIEQGMEALISNAINGISSPEGAMPPKGGFPDLSDEQVAVAVSYMVEATQ